VCTDVSPWILRNPWHGISTDNPIRPTKSPDGKKLLLFMKYRLRRDQRQSLRHGSCADKYNERIINSLCGTFCFATITVLFSNTRLMKVYFSILNTWVSNFVIRRRSYRNN